MASNSPDLLHDFSPLFRQNKDGSVERLLGIEFVPPSLDPSTGVQSKDVVISSETGLSARLYLPSKADPTKKLPLLVFYHGGGFVIESPFSPPYQKHLNYQVAEANVIAVSVNYRLAPENPLPAAYEDSWLALKWIASDACHEQWIKDYADMSRVYIAGDSAGGNIAHHVALRSGLEKVDGINLAGVILNCPYFCGKETLPSEEKHPLFSKKYLNDLWHYVCGHTKDSDHPWANPGTDPNLSRFGCKRLLVYVGEKDASRDRGWYYKDAMSKSGWNGEIEVVEVKGEDHVFSVAAPESENGMAMLKKVASFININN